MPVSRKGIPYYTKEQYDYARYQTSALAYAKAQGYALIRHGQYYQLKDHDSMVFKEDGTWYWNSRGLKGGAIEFITAFENKSLVEAVLILNSESAAQVKQTDAQREFIPREKKPFELPAHASNYKRLFAYLCGTRRLDKEIVQELVHQKLIYESSKSFHRDGKTSELHNAVFVSYNEQGDAVAAFERGTSTYASYRGDVPGSDKANYGWLMSGAAAADTVYVFEAAIDAVSHASLYKLDGQDYHSVARLSLGGVSNIQPLINYLQSHSSIKNITLCFDNDNAGNTGVIHAQEKLAEHGFTQDAGYHVQHDMPPEGKDFNAYLQRRIQCEAAHQHDAHIEIISGTGGNTVYLFQNQSDAVAHATLEKMLCRNCDAAARIVLGDHSAYAVRQYLDSHTQVQRIVFCFAKDNIQALQEIKSELKNVGITSDNGYLLCKQQAPQCDNFTEYLQIQMQTIEAQQAALKNSLTENNELEL